MIIGIVKEIKNNENRVAITPSGVQALVKQGHTVFIETNAGLGSHILNEEYIDAGAVILEHVSDVWAAEMVLKVKEPLPEEFQYFRPGLILFTYLHLAPEPTLTKALMDHQVTAIAYETVQLSDGKLPLLIPMSEIAGRMSVQIGAQYLEKHHGGKGVLLSGIPGVKKGKVVIIGAGNAGANAAKMAIGLGAYVVVLDVNVQSLLLLENQYPNQIQTLMSTPMNIGEEIKDADLVIGAVLIAGKKAPTLVSKEMVQQMKPGSVIVDIAIDQGGIFETIDRITTHDNPIYKVNDILHYAVANMPGAVPQTATYGLTNATLPYIQLIANLGYLNAINKNNALKKGVNVYKGYVTCQAVSEAQNIEYRDLDSLI